MSPLLWPRLIPATDYPQHLALSEIARRLLDPSAPEHATFVANWFTYNGLFHLLVSRLGVIMPIELAGRLVASASLGLLANSTRGLLAAIGRPVRLAFLFVPALFSFALAWGFMNYVLGTALAIATLALIARSLKRPTWAGAVAIGLMSLVTAAAHVLAMLELCLLAAALAPELSWRAVRDQGEGLGARAARAFGHVVAALAPILLGCVYCIVVYRIQYEWNPGMYRDPTMEGSSLLWTSKVLTFPIWTTGAHGDTTDQALVLATLATVAAAAGVWLWRKRPGSAVEPSVLAAAQLPDEGPIYLPLVAMSIAYFVTPMVFIGTHLIFPRLAQCVVLALVLAAPCVIHERPFRQLPLALACLTGLNLLGHAVVFAWETDDASKVIDELPPGRNATALLWQGATFSFQQSVLTHLAGYYAARKHGRWAFEFARYLSVPVRFRGSAAVAWPTRGWEFSPGDYDPRCGYARYYDLVLVRVPADLSDVAQEATVRKLSFGQDADRVQLLSHHGAFWAFDTRGVPSNGRP